MLYWTLLTSIVINLRSIQDARTLLPQLSALVNSKLRTLIWVRVYTRNNWPSVTNVWNRLAMLTSSSWTYILDILCEPDTPSQLQLARRACVRPCYGLWGCLALTLWRHANLFCFHRRVWQQDTSQYSTQKYNDEWDCCGISPERWQVLFCVSSSVHLADWN